MSVKTTIVKFDGTNFKVWKFQIDMYFRSQGWGKVLVKPTVPYTKDEKEEIGMLDNQAWPTLALTLDSDQAEKVMHCTSSRQAMDILESEYASTSFTRRFLLMRELYTTRLIEGGDVPAHARKIEQLVRDARAATSDDTIVSDEQAAYILIISLPESWQTLISAVLASSAHNNNKIKFDTVKDVILAENLKRQAVNAPVEGAMLAKANQRKPLLCTYCKRTNHTVDRCWNKERDEKAAAAAASNPK